MPLSFRAVRKTLSHDVDMMREADSFLAGKELDNGHIPRRVQEKLFQYMLAVFPNRRATRGAIKKFCANRRLQVVS